MDASTLRALLRLPAPDDAAELALARVMAGDAGQAEAILLLVHLAGATRAALTAGGSRLDVREHAYASWGRGQPTGVVLHVTARCGGRESCGARAAAAGFMRSGAAASTHGVVGFGDLWAPVRHDRPAWHTGDPDGPGGRFGDVNRSHLGLDLASPGPVERHGLSWYRPGAVVRDGREGRWLRWRNREGATCWALEQPLARPDGTPFAAGDVLELEAPGAYGLRSWHLCPPEQVLALAVLLRALRLAYPSVLPDRVVRHADLAPGKRVDPGPSVPLEALRGWCWGDEDLAELVAAAAAGGWAGWLQEQWAAPTGVVVPGVDDVIPGRLLRGVRKGGAA